MGRPQVDGVAFFAVQFVEFLTHAVEVPVFSVGPLFDVLGLVHDNVMVPSPQADGVGARPGE
ncbi:hypothetical protein LP52_21805 [Streptomonospora alba]|uniref:Uncharacterized protein n=1 Tax=Streptomonospora alba TaxID=183763 RepID=A0A0C2JJ34_9ACTN|nr:hypothetical protein LP52_21805 [Streptomonospora alba]